MVQKKIIFLIAAFLLILVLIPFVISKFSQEPNSPVPTPSISLPTQIVSSPTPVTSFPVAGLEMVIFKDKQASVPYSNIIIKLTNVSIPSKQCIDCITSATIQVRKDNQLKELLYTSGGFAGTLVDKQDAFGYSFTISNLQKDSLTVKINRK